LVNGLCGTKHAAGEGRGSVTRNLFRNDVSWGEYAFSLIDTPGTDSSTETYKHAYLLKHALTATKINTIFIVIKYDGRFDKMIDNYFEVEQPVKNNANKIVVMVSYGDQSKNPEKSFKEICKLFEEECPNVVNLIFYSEGSSKPQIANLMYNCISNMKEERLDINT
jgi:predicted GTPase